MIIELMVPAGIGIGFLFGYRRGTQVGQQQLLAKFLDRAIHQKLHARNGETRRPPSKEKE